MTAISWAAGRAGFWSRGSDWTGGVAPGPGDDVTVNAAGAYTVRIYSLASAHSLTVNSAGATIDCARTLTIGSSLNLLAGVFDLKGGGIQGGVVNVDGGQFQMNYGTFSNLTFEGALNFSPAFSFLGLSGAVDFTGVNGVGPGTINCVGSNNTLALAVGCDLNGGVLNVGGAAISTYFDGDATFGNSFTINAVGYTTIGGDYGRSGTVINDGAILADTSGARLFVDPAVFENNGLIELSHGAQLSFYNQLTTAQLGHVAFGAGGGFIGFDIDNANAILDLGQGATVAGTVTGGVIAGSILVGPSLGLTLAGGVSMTGPDGTGRGAINVEADDSALLLAGTELIDNAIINVGAGGEFGASITTTGDSSSVVTLGSGVTINVVAGFAWLGQSARLGSGLGTIVNEGTINAAVGGGSLVIDPAVFVNRGVIHLDNGAKVSFGSGLITAELGSVTIGKGGGELEFSAGGLDNAGAVFALPRHAILDGEITGGIVAGVLDGTGPFGLGGYLLLNAVAWQGTINVKATDGSLQVEGGLTMTGAGGLGGGVINVTGPRAGLVLENTETLSNLSIVLGRNGNSGAAIANEGGSASVVTLASSVTIDQGGGLVFLGAAPFWAGGEGTIVNDGVIEANVARGHFIVDPTTFVNSGAIIVGGGDEVDLSSTSLANLSGGVLTGGVYQVGAGSALLLPSGASLTTDDATILLDGAGSSLGGATPIDTTLTLIGANGSLSLLGGRNWSSTTTLVNAGQLELGGGTFAPGAVIDEGVLSGYGLIEAKLAVIGVVEAAAGNLELAQSVGGAGQLRIDGYSRLRVDGLAARTLTVDFSGPGAVLALGASAHCNATLVGFAAGETIDLLGRVATAARLVAGDRLVIANGDKVVATLHLAGDYGNDAFAVNSDGAGGCDVTLVASDRTTLVAQAGASFAPAGGATAAAAWRNTGVAPALATPGVGH